MRWPTDGQHTSFYHSPLPKQRVEYIVIIRSSLNEWHHNTASGNHSLDKPTSLLTTIPVDNITSCIASNNHRRDKPPYLLTTYIVTKIWTHSTSYHTSSEIIYEHNILIIRNHNYSYIIMSSSEISSLDRSYITSYHDSISSSS